MIAMKLFKVKLKTCEQHLDSIGLQLIFLASRVFGMQEKPSFPECSGLKINMSLSKIHFNFKQLQYIKIMVFIILKKEIIIRID